MAPLVSELQALGLRDTLADFGGRLKAVFVKAGAGSEDGVEVGRGGGVEAARGHIRARAVACI
jgi:hypothetical protein